MFSVSQRDIEDMLNRIYGTEISQGLISRITDKILPEVNEWQNRPLEAIYPVVFFDGIVFNSRKDNRIITKCVYSVLGINMGGIRKSSAPGYRKTSQRASMQAYVLTFKAAA